MAKYKITVSANSGSGGTTEFYYDSTTKKFYSSSELTTEISRITPHTRQSYIFLGCYSNNSSTGVLRVQQDGTIIKEGWTPAGSQTIYARWTGVQYTLYFDYGDGTGDVASMPVTFGSEIGTLPRPTSRHGDFTRWTLNGSTIRYSTVWNISGNGTAVAEYNPYFGRLTDWFGLETANGPLMLVGSTDGATRSVTETSHSGALAIQTANSSVGAFECGGILMNPTCTYRIRSAGNVVIYPGKAYGKATISGSGASSKVTASGYMLVSAEYATAADGEPVLVVRGTANEGFEWNSNWSIRSSKLTDAINTWSVTLAVSPDHIAQDPMSAVNGGGELTECKTLITCDPVVPMENGMPCASDVVHGKVIVTATTNAYNGESAPTARSPFVEINGVPPDETDVDFTSYAFTAERSL